MDEKRKSGIHKGLSKLGAYLAVIGYAGTFGGHSIYQPEVSIFDFTWDIWVAKIVCALIIVGCIEWLWRKL